MGSLPRLELRCFGPPTALLDGGVPPAEVLWRKHLALLVYLALSPGRTRARDHLLGLLWPEKPEAQARHSLNEALRRLRTHLGTGRIVSRGDQLTLADTGLDVDALQFDAQFARKPGLAAELLHGGFLEAFTLDDAPAFEEWAHVERSRLEARAVTALVTSGEEALQQCAFPAAQDAARRALGLSAFAEPAVRLVMRSAALAGDSSGALAAFHEFQQRLERELGEQPGPGLSALAERIRRHDRRAASATPRHTNEPPLVGRAAAHRAAFAPLEDVVRGLPRTVLITGGPGMGRTRLLAECGRRVALDGGAVCFARPLESDVDAPWSTVRALVRAGLASAPGLAGSPPDALKILAGVAPEVATGEVPLPSPFAPPDTAEVAAALAAVLQALAEEQPIALGIDDAHLADSASLEAVGTAVGRLGQTGGAPVALLLTAPESGAELPRAFLRMRSEIGRSLPGTTVHLEPLSDADVAQLVEAVATWCTKPDDRDRLARRIRFETGGAPLLAVTLLQALESASTLREDVLAWPRRHRTLDAPLPISVPELAKMAVVARVAAVPEETRQVLRAASIGGLALDLDLLGALTGLARDRLEQSLTTLEEHGFITFDGQRYVFEAPLIAEVVRRECMKPGQRRHLRERASDALAARPDLESRVLRVELLARARPGAPTAAEAAAVTRDALAAGTVRSARRAIAAAERALGTGSANERRTLDDLRRQVDALQA